MGIERRPDTHHAISVTGIQFEPAGLWLGYEGRPSDCEYQSADLICRCHKPKNYAQQFLEAISEALDTAVSSKIGSDLVGQSHADI